MPINRKTRIRTTATFTSGSFKTADLEEKPRFRGAYGDDTAIWLMLELEMRGVDVEPGIVQADVGWYFTCRISGREYVMRVCLSDPAGSVWQVSVERNVTGVAALFGGRKRAVRGEAVQSLHLALAGSDKVRGVWWHLEQDIKAGRDGKGISQPIAAG